MDFIKSLSNPLVKHFVRLVTSRSHRKEEGFAVVFGTKIISELSGVIPIEKYLGVNSFIDSANEVIKITPQIAQKITGYPSFDDGIALIKLPEYQNLSTKERVIILENIQDPGNLGTILRTAKAMGFDGVHLTGNCADPFNQKAISASKGCAFTMPLGCGEIDHLSERFHFYAADMKGDDITTISFQKPYALIFGNEGSGISDPLKKASSMVAIELQNEVESLNVASAAAIFCFAGARSEI